jgi:hypothetical protein
MVVQRSPQRQLTRFQNPVSTMNEDGTMANNENSNSITLDTIAQMIKDQGEGVKKSIDEVRNSMDNAIMQLSTRIKGVEAAITTQRCRTDALQKDVLGLRDDLQAVRSTIHTSVTEMEDVIREGQLRFAKQCNLVFMGVPEDEQALSVVSDMLRIISPDNKISIENNRLGNQGSSRNPRPLRVTFPSVEERRAALRNCKKLKGHTEFKGISVKPDLTKRQISMLNERRSEDLWTRFQSSSTTTTHQRNNRGLGQGSKRKSQSDDQQQSQATRRPRMDHAPNDNTSMD